MKDLDLLTVEELGRLFPIQIVKANPEWPTIFECEKSILLNILGSDISLRIEHFGSTAVPNLAAKPTIDILVEIPDNDYVKKDIIEIMDANGFHSILRTDSPPPYSMFVKGYTLEGFSGQCFHVHMAPTNHSGLWDRIYFRDYLIANPDVAKEYEELKKTLAIKHQFNREDYTEAKKEFVATVTEKAKRIAINKH